MFSTDYMTALNPQKVLSIYVITARINYVTLSVTGLASAMVTIATMAPWYSMTRAFGLNHSIHTWITFMSLTI